MDFAVEKSVVSEILRTLYHNHAPSDIAKLELIAVL